MTVNISHMGNPKKKKNDLSGFPTAVKSLEKKNFLKSHLKEVVTIVKCSLALSN